MQIIIDGQDYDPEDIFYCVNCISFVPDDRYEQGSY